MEIEKLEDLLTVDTQLLKSAEKEKLLKCIKRLLKAQGKESKKDEVLASELPYTAVGLVGNKLTYVKYSIASNQAVVDETKVDSADSGNQNHMAAFAGIELLREQARDSKGDEGNE